MTGFTSRSRSAVAIAAAEAANERRLMVRIILAIGGMCLVLIAISAHS